MTLMDFFSVHKKIHFPVFRHSRIQVGWATHQLILIEARGFLLSPRRPFTLKNDEIPTIASPQQTSLLKPCRFRIQNGCWFPVFSEIPFGKAPPLCTGTCLREAATAKTGDEGGAESCYRRQGVVQTFVIQLPFLGLLTMIEIFANFLY